VRELKEAFADTLAFLNAEHDHGMHRTPAPLSMGTW
jgi:hypothetical protein